MRDTRFEAARSCRRAARRSEGGSLILLCRDSSTLLAKGSVSDMVAQLTRKGHRVVGAGIVLASGRPLPDLAAILRSHALIHTAEGEFFREAMVRASEHCSLPVTRVKEREIWDKALRCFASTPPTCNNGSGYSDDRSDHRGDRMKSWRRWLRGSRWPSRICYDHDQSPQTSRIPRCGAIPATAAAWSDPFARTWRDSFLKHWQVTKDYTIAFADALPAEDYGYKPVDVQRSYAEQLLHLASANARTCPHSSSSQRPRG